MSQTKRVSGRATTIVRTDGGIGVQYHRTLVAFKRLDGTVVLNSGGWRTATTKLRMNQFANEYAQGRFQVWQHKGGWYVGVRVSPDLPMETHVFFDGMEVQV